MLIWIVDELHAGSAKLAGIIPDDKHAAMWRISWPDGGVSGMLNRSRAKDAAMARARREADERRKK